MPFDKQETMTCDVLVVGSGGAGLRAAIAAAESGADVLMISKARIGHATNTYISKSIIASSGWGDPEDSCQVHTRDTIRGGRWMNDPNIVAGFTKAIRSETAILRKWGVGFAADDKGNPAVLKIPGHSHARHLFGGNLCGRDLVLPLKQKTVESGVRFLEHAFVSSLVVVDGGIRGAVGISKEGAFIAIRAGAVILATGGFGHLFQNTNNAPGITGDGQALALKAGVPLRDMEFVQFYPTATGKYGSRILLYERVLVQDGVVLRNGRGEDIMVKSGRNPAEITRDELARIIMTEIINDPNGRGTVVMDLGGLSEEAGKSLAALLPASWFKGETVFEVTPTTHFCMGGVVTDTLGQTSCPGLYAAGEVTAGAHGANRLGGNALAEIIAMGGVVGKAAADGAVAVDSSAGSGFDNAVLYERKRLAGLVREKGVRPIDLIDELKKNMWLNAGIIRDHASLERAISSISGREETGASVTTPKHLIRFLEYQNMRLVGEVVCRSALERTESRGSHFRSDFPHENNETWLKNIQVRKTETGFTLEHIPVDGPRV